jgi:hypothetical protein
LRSMVLISKKQIDQAVAIDAVNGQQPDTK